MYHPRQRRRYIWIVLLLLGLILLNLPFVRRMPPIKFTRKLLLTIVYPFQYSLTTATSWTVGTFKTIIHLRRVAKENAVLKIKLAELLAKEKMYEALEEENTRLRKSLEFRTGSSYSSRMIGARIVARSPSNWFEVIEINRGKRDGVTEDMAVVSQDGLVGRTIEVARTSSKVLLITDPGSSVGGQSLTSRDLGIVVGGAMESLRMNFVVPAAKIDVGDIIVTSGIGRIFSKGIPIGRVTKVYMRDYDIFKHVEIEPLVNFSKLEHIFVILTSPALRGRP